MQTSNWSWQLHLFNTHLPDRLSRLLILTAMSLVVGSFIGMMTAHETGVVVVFGLPVVWFFFAAIRSLGAPLLQATRKGGELLGLDIVNVMLTFIAFFSMGELFVTFVDTNPILAVKAGFLAMMNMAVLSSVIYEIRAKKTADWYPKAPQRASSYAIIIAGFLTLILIQILIFRIIPPLSFLDVGLQQIFYSASAISEENIFRYLLQTVTYVATGSPFIAIAHQGFWFSVYHWYVYGQVLGAMLFVLVAAIIFGIEFQFLDTPHSSSLTITQLQHVLINLGSLSILRLG